MGISLMTSVTTIAMVLVVNDNGKKEKNNKKERTGDECRREPKALHIENPQ